MVRHKALLKDAEIREATVADLDLPSLPAEGRRLLGMFAKRFASDHVVLPKRGHFKSDVEVSSYSSASGPWYGDRRIRYVVWPGDLTIEGDLLDDAFDGMPLLIVHGHLTVRSWLRGGMPSFVAGSVRASGFIVGHYNDSALFVGGDLEAAGFLPRAKPYPDLPKIQPHQIAGRLGARRLDVLDATDAELKAALVDDVLETGDDEDGVALDARAVLARHQAGLPVWR